MSPFHTVLSTGSVARGVQVRQTGWGRRRLGEVKQSRSICIKGRNIHIRPIAVSIIFKCHRHLNGFSTNRTLMNLFTDSIFIFYINLFYHGKGSPT